MSYIHPPDWYKSFLNSLEIKDTPLEDRSAFILNQVPGVLKMAFKFSKDGEDFMDRVQDGIVGLLRAYDNYDPEKNGFYSYSRMWVTASIIEGFRLSCGLVTCPRHTFTRGQKIQELLKEGKTTEEISQHFNRRSKKYRSVSKDSVQYYKNQYYDRLRDVNYDFNEGSFAESPDYYIHTRIINMLENLTDIKLESVLCRITGESSQELADKKGCSRTNINNHIRDVQNTFMETFKGVDY